MYSRELAMFLDTFSQNICFEFQKVNMTVVFRVFSLILGLNFKKNDKTFQSEKHVSTATSVIFS